MKRLVVALTFAAACGLFHAETAQAVLCKCGPQQSTPTISVTGGSTCSEVTTSLSSALWTYITCDLCRQPVLTSSCSTIRGEDLFIVSATGYFTYRCYQTGPCEIP